MAESVFYWECRGQSYHFDSTKKYLIYFKGCYCPPTRGHFDTVKRFIDMGPNVYVMNHQIGSKSRHGVPRHLNREIWKCYIRELLPPDRVHLVAYESYDDIINLNRIIDTVDTVIYIRGNEGYDIIETEKLMHNRFRSLIKQLNRMEINMDFYYLDRPHAHKLSASKFIQMLIRTKKRCRKRNCNCSYKKLKFFMPFDLPEEVAMKLVRKMQSNYLK